MARHRTPWISLTTIDAQGISTPPPKSTAQASGVQAELDAKLAALQLPYASRARDVMQVGKAASVAMEVLPITIEDFVKSLQLSDRLLLNNLIIQAKDSHSFANHISQILTTKSRLITLLENNIFRKCRPAKVPSRFMPSYACTTVIESLDLKVTPSTIVITFIPQITSIPSHTATFDFRAIVLENLTSCILPQ